GKLSRLSPRIFLPIEFILAAAGLIIVFATSSVAVITVGAIITGFGTGMLLPTLLTWAVNRLTFLQRGRGVGIWTGTLFIGEFLSPLIIAALAAKTSGLQAGLAVLGVAAAIMAAVTFFALRRNTERLDESHA
ncbi:MFS transporter, partial [Pseudomonas aeruginosa]|uniref:MFS transporter n=1 Tax=Pseudomonas aeruginosa TaxID=287 RepID=UPI002F909E24